MSGDAPDLVRMSLNQMTARNLSVREVAELCATHGIQHVGLWREPVARTGLRESAQIVREFGVLVSSLCRGGFFPGETEAKRRESLDDNRRAVEEAAELGTDTLVLVCGGMAGQDLEAARRAVSDGIHELAPFANSHRIRLGVEPLHPMYAATRSVIVTTAQALRMVADLPAELAGVVLDVYHIWWDPDLYREIERARGRIFGFHVCDWLDPMPDVLNGRGMMGDGFADIRRIRKAVEAAGYGGTIEVEIFNQQIWDLPGEALAALLKERWQRFV
jgi:sugar phosphate isomerase/epimerase